MPNSTPIRPRVFKLNRNVVQHELLCTSYCWIISLYKFGVVAPEILKFYIDYYQFCSMPDSTPIKPTVFKLQKNVAQHLTALIIQSFQLSPLDYNVELFPFSN